jgi:hypothetical protein
LLVSALRPVGDFLAVWAKSERITEDTVLSGHCDTINNNPDPTMIDHSEGKQRIPGPARPRAGVECWCVVLLEQAI